MNKVPIVALALTFLLMLAFMVITYTSDYNSVYNNYLGDIKMQFGVNNISSVKIEKYPIPHIIIDKIEREGKVELQKIEIKFSLLSLIQLRPQVSDLKIGSARINMQHGGWNLANHENLVAEFLNKVNNTTNIEINNLYLLDENSNPEIIVKDLQVSNKGSFKGLLHDIGSFTGSISQNQGENKLNIKILSTNYDIEINELYKGMKLISGDFNCNILNLSNFLNSNFSNFQSLLNKFSSNEIINIKSNIVSSDQLLVFRNLSVKSSAVEGSGEIQLSKVPKISSLIDINFSKIDLNGLVAKDQNQHTNRSYKGDSRFNFADKLLKSQISINKINLGGNEELSNIKFDGDLQNGKFVVKDLSGKIDNNGSFTLSGEIQQNAYRNLFEGKISIKHEDFNKIINKIGYGEDKVEKPISFTLTSDLKCTIIDFYLQNLLIKTDNLKLNANLSSKFIGVTPRVTANLNISSLDLSKSDYPVISKLQKCHGASS